MELLEHPRFINCRCRKCKQLISFKFLTKEDYNNNLNYTSGIKISKNQMHPNCFIDDTEIVYCDLISISEKQIKDSIIVWEEEVKEE